MTYTIEGHDAVTDAVLDRLIAAYGINTNDGNSENQAIFAQLVTTAEAAATEAFDAGMASQADWINAAFNLATA